LLVRVDEFALLSLASVPAAKFVCREQNGTEGTGEGELWPIPQRNARMLPAPALPPRRGNIAAPTVKASGTEAKSTACAATPIVAARSPNRKRQVRSVISSAVWLDSQAGVRQRCLWPIILPENRESGAPPSPAHRASRCGLGPAATRPARRAGHWPAPARRPALDAQGLLRPPAALMGKRAR